MKLDLDQLRIHIRTGLSRRSAHIFGCEETAAALSKRWGADEEKARTAALLHDLTKYYSDDEQLKLAEKYRIIQVNDFSKYPPVIHAFTAAALAQYEYMQNSDIVEAVRWHTTGRAGMSLLEKIIYLSDTIEPGRDFPGVDDIRGSANEDIDEAMLKALTRSVVFNMEKKAPIYPASLEAYNYLIFNKNSLENE